MIMKEVDYTAIIPYKIKDIVFLIISNKKILFTEAIDYLYNSELYEYLSNEETKFWHFSTAKLYDLLENEKQTNFLEFPDFV